MNDKKEYKLANWLNITSIENLIQENSPKKRKKDNDHLLHNIQNNN